MTANGRAELLTLAFLPENDPKDWMSLSAAAKADLNDWIMTRLRSSKARVNSYGLKHRFKAESGIYVTNGQFKGAMLLAGYDPIEWLEVNWEFHASLTFRLRGEE